jgi:hypothetical protein
VGSHSSCRGNKEASDVEQRPKSWGGEERDPRDVDSVQCSIDRGHEIKIVGGGRLPKEGSLSHKVLCMWRVWPLRQSVSSGQEGQGDKGQEAASGCSGRGGGP